jgi:hypothetical protein
VAVVLEEHGDHVFALVQKRRQIDDVVMKTPRLTADGAA